MFFKKLLQRFGGDADLDGDGGSAASRKAHSADEAPTLRDLNVDTLYKTDYFSSRFNEVVESLSKIGNIKIDTITMESGQRIIVKFARDGKDYKASFVVEREPSSTTYSLEVDMPNTPSRGKRYVKTSAGRTPQQILNAIVFSFHEAFVEG